MKYMASLVVWVCLVPMASAASYDCKRSLSQIEAAICGNSSLSRADDDLAAAYKSALSVNLLPQELQTQQHIWLSTRDRFSNDPTALLQVYRKRISELQRDADSWRPANAKLTEEQARQTCVALPTNVDECRVEAFGNVNGSKAGELKYQQQSYWYKGERGVEGSLVVFRSIAGKSPSLQPIAAASNEAYNFRSAELIESPVAQWLLITGNSGEHGYMEFLFAYRDGAIAGIDTKSWQSELLRRKPEELDLADYILPDYRAMTATAVFTKNGDPFCCTNSYVAALIHLGLSGNRLTLKDVRFSRRTNPNAK